MSNLSFAQSISLNRKNQITITMAYYLVFISLGLAAISFGPTIPSLAKHTGSDLSEISYLFTARALGGLLGSFWLGRSYDRWPGHLLMAIFLSTMAAMMVLIPIIPLLWLLIIILLVLGTVEGAMHVGGNTLLVWVHGSKFGPYMNGMHFFFGFGGLMSPIIVTQLMLMTGDIIWPYWLLALLILPSIIWLTRLSSPALPASMGEKQTGPTNRFLMVLFVLSFLLYVGMEVSFSGWIFTYTLTTGLGAEATAAYLTAVFWGAITVSRLLAIPLAVKLRPRTILLSDLTGALASAGLILFWENSLTAIWLGTVGLGLSFGSIFATLISLAERRMIITGKITGWFMVGGSLGAMSLPWLVGQLFEVIGPQVFPQVIFTTLIVTLGIMLMLVRNPPLESTGAILTSSQ